MDRSAKKMRHIKYYLFLAFFCPILSCSDSPSNEMGLAEEKPMEVLPFNHLDLNDLAAFRPVAENWNIVGNTNVDHANAGKFLTDPGMGILVNTPEEGMNDNLFTTFDHGDIEIELDVMMPKQSNSGLYFQGRYEVQLLDSWGVETPQHSDIGGIYQRWDDTREQKGYEGHASGVNAAKAPGLWQHFKIKFHAPRFDAAGNKVKNARFEEVWLNGSLLHKNQEVTGPTRASAYQDEQPKGPLMIQGDHGAVAFRNIKYKLFDGQSVSLGDIRLTEYEPYKAATRRIPNFDSLIVESEISTDRISSAMATGENPQKLLVFNGQMNIPNSGDYIFEMKVDGGGAVLLINRDTIVNLDGDYYLNNPGLALASLEKGIVPFTLIYNKHRPFRRGLSLAVEGPGIPKHDLHAAGSIDPRRLPGNGQKVAIVVSDETILQRGFLMHEGIKRTHVISVGTPESIHYSFDLANGSLLQAWGGEFLDATGMWVGRGSEQLAFPIGNPIASFGGPDFAYLRNSRANWPDSILANTTYRQLGYELDQQGNPKFMMELNGSMVASSFIPVETSRGLKRIISTNSDKELWHKLGEGSTIEKLSDEIYVMADKSYFIHLTMNDQYTPVIRNSGGKEELVVKLPSGNQEFSYTISW